MKTSEKATSTLLTVRNITSVAFPKLNLLNKRGNEYSDMSNRGQYIKMSFDASSLNYCTDVYFTVRTDTKYIRFAIIAIGKEDGAMNFVVTTRTEGDQSTIVEDYVGSDCLTAVSALFGTIELNNLGEQL